MNPTIKLLILGLFFSVQAFGQTEFPNTMHVKNPTESPDADLSAVDWITGYWTGEALGGITEEIWSEPLGGSMMGTFKLVENDSVVFYELMTMVEENNSLILRLKHFDGDLVGWEEKDETVDFKLVKIEPGKVFFNGLTFERISDDEINIYVIFDTNGELSEMKFNFKRVNF